MSFRSVASRQRLQFLPLALINAGLPEYASEEASSDITTMWIRNPYGHVIFDQKLMFSAREGSFEAQLFQKANQIPPFDWTKGRHQAISLMVKSIPSRTGSGRL